MKKILIILAILFTGIVQSAQYWPRHVYYNADRELVLAASKNDFEGVQKALASGADINYQDQYLNSALLIAVIMHNKEMVKKIIDSGADLNLKDQHGDSALLIAAEHDNFPEIVKLLLEAGADITQKDKNGQSFLDIIEKQNKSAIKKVYEDYAIEHRIAIAAKLALFLTKDTSGIVAGYCA